MIQRIQTLFWLINLLLLLLGYYFFPWPDSAFPFDATAVPVKEIFVGGVAVIQLITLLGYKKRLLQLRFTLVLQGLYALVFGVFVYHWWQSQQYDSLGWGGVLAVSMLLLLLAYRAVQRDERLVRSVDRIR
jgi:hypothetical protein